MNDWVQSKLEKGREWIARPKLWLARGVASEPAFAGRYYIAAEDRNDALAVLKQLDPGFEIRDMYVTDSDPGDNTYEAYKTAQEDLIRQQNAERAQRQAAQDETVDVSNLRGYRVSNSRTYMYVVAENGGEAAEIAIKIDPERFPDISDITVQDAGSIGAETLIRGMYARQQSLLSNPQPSAPKFEVNDRVEVKSGYPSLNGMKGTVLQVSPNYDFVSVQIDGNDTASSFPLSSLKKVEEPTPRMEPGEQMYLVRNNDTGHEVRLAAGSEQNARGRAIRNDPHNFTGGADITITQLRTPPPAQQDTQSSTLPPPRFGESRFYVQNVATGEAMQLNSDNGVGALADAEISRPDWDRQDIRVSRTPFAAAEQESPASSPNNTRISDLRYYRVERQDASGIANIAASSREEAMNRAREQNPTWRNSPLTARPF
jgi:hypothetical protein